MSYLVILVMASCWQGTSTTDKYMGQKGPGVEPEVFAPGVISKKGEYEYGSVFSENGLEFYYGVALGNRAEIRFSQMKDGQWTAPVVLIAHETYSYNDPFLSPDEKRLYFITNMPLSGQGPAKEDHDILYVERQGDSWSKPLDPGPAINTEHNEYYMSFTKDGTMYFSTNAYAEDGEDGNFDIYASPWQDNAFQKPHKLSDAINTKAYEADVFIPQDGSYLIFCATRRSGLGRGDLYISFKQKDGSWSKAKNMGPKINSKNHELCPFVSVDGRYFFYTSNKDIYWVDAAILETYR